MDKSDKQVYSVGAGSGGQKSSKNQDYEDYVWDGRGPPPCDSGIVSQCRGPDLSTDIDSILSATNQTGGQEITTPVNLNASNQTSNQSQAKNQTGSQDSSKNQTDIGKDGPAILPAISNATNATDETQLMTIDDMVKGEKIINNK